MNTPASSMIDEEAATPTSTRNALLADALRETTPVRHIFVQKPLNTTKPARGQQRGSILGQMVESHQERALDAYLFLLGIEPVLEDDPLAAAAWARALSTGVAEVPESAITRVWRQLKDRQLVAVERRQRMSYVLPLLEDGSGKVYTRPGTGKETTKGWPAEDFYLGLPNAYWTEGYFQKLSLTGKALLLISLQATGLKDEYYLPHKAASDWYGISADSVEKGLAELRAQALITERPQKKHAPRAPDGFTIRTYYSLTGPFSTASRSAARAKAQEERAKKTSSVTAEEPDATQEGGDADG